MFAPLETENSFAWHGTPDAYVKSVQIQNKEAEEDECESDSDDSRSDYKSKECDSDESDGTSTNIEGNKKLGQAYIPQGIATYVVSSFTFKSRHPSQNTI